MRIESVWRLVVLACLGAVVGGCAGDVTETAAYKTLADERDAVQAELDEAVAEREAADDEIAELRRDAEDAAATASETQDRIAELEGSLSDAETALSDASESAAKAASVNDAFVDFVEQLFVFQFADDGEGSRCLAEQVVADEALLENFVDWFFAFDLQDLALLDEAAIDCGLDPAALAGTEVQSGQAYGDNPELDALYDACEAGNGVACDDLYFSSEAGSEYELFGGTCGGRFDSIEETPETCVGNT